MNFMKGYLSYALAILVVLGGGAGYLLQVIDGEQALTMIWAGLALFGLRRAIQPIRYAFAIGVGVVLLLFFAVPVKSEAPITPEEPPLDTAEAREAFAHKMADEYDLSWKFVETLRGESMDFTWNDQSLIEADGPNGREDSWGVCQIHLPSHPEITKEQALDPRWCIEWSAQQFSDGNARKWTVYRNL